MLAIINQLAEAGIHVYLEQGKLKTRAAKNSMTPQLVDIIRQNKTSLMAYLASAEGEQLRSNIKRQAIVPLPRTAEPMVCSFAQERLWFIDQLEGGSPQYNMPMKVVIEDAFDIKLAERAFKRIIQRHEPLRTVFVETPEGPMQVVNDDFEFKLDFFDLTKLNGQSLQNKFWQLTQQERHKVFDLKRDLMLRAAFIKLPEQDGRKQGVLLYTLHHIAGDGWSIDVLDKEFSTLYQAFANQQADPLAPLAIQYADYALWQREWLSGEVLERQLNFWDQQLAEVPLVHHLPLDFARPQHKSHQGAIVKASLAPSLARRLMAVVQQFEVTPFMLLHGALCLVLSRHSNCQDIVLGSPVANRMQLEIEPLIGFFVNTMVLRVDTGYTRFSDYIGHIKQVNLDAQAHQDVPFETLVERCKIPRTSQHTPLFQLMFSMNTNTGGQNKNAGHGASRIHFSDNEVAKFDLTLDAQLSESGGMLSWEYDKSLFKREHIEQFNLHMQRLLAGFVKADESMALSDLTMLSDKEIKWHMERSSGNWLKEQHPEVLIHQVFEQQAQIFGEQIALTMENGKISYCQLNEQANQMAGYLLEAGLTPGTPVGICIDRCPQMVIAILAILKVGSAYVPMDPNYPANRLTHMLTDSRVNLLLSRSKIGNIELPNEVRLIDLDCDDFKTQVASHSKDNLNLPGLQPDLLAYIIYTSGSTGSPKGVMVEHRQWSAYLAAITTLYQPKPVDRVLQFSSLSFDIFIEEFSLSLLSGGQLVLPGEAKVPAVHEFWQLLRGQQITIISVPTAYWQLVASESELSIELANCDLHTIITGGEALSVNAVAYWQHNAEAKVKLFNTYGPTEATVIASACEVSDYLKHNQPEAIPIGTPLNNSRLLVLDRWQQMVPRGCVGELFIGGSSVARGYLNQPELTAQQFIDISGGGNMTGRWYKTGDLVRYLADGNLQFVGRGDDQVKINGFRIELAEIENQLVLAVEVASCLVKVWRQNLVAYVVLEKSISIDTTINTRLKQHLAVLLPEFMVPSVFVVIDKWPLTANGKVDKKVLPRPDNSLLVGEYVAPGNDTERQMVAIWANLLKLPVETISVEANFFAIGGHSLMSVRLVAAIREQFNHEIAIKTIFEKPSISQLSAQIRSGSSLSLRHQVSALPRDGSPLPLSFAQQRLWFIDQMEGGSPQYNMPTAIPVNTAFDVGCAERAFTRIIERHEPLRTVFAEGNSGPVQIIREQVKFHIQRIDLTETEPPQQQIELRRLMIHERENAFDLSRDLLLRARFIELSKVVGQQRGVMMFTLHHIAADGWSMNILVEEFDTLYQAFIDGKEDPLDPLKIQYADYAKWQRDWLNNEVMAKQFDYWLQQLEDVPHLHRLRLDYARPMMKSHKGAMITQGISSKLCRQLEAQAQQLSVTPFMLLHGAVALLLARHGNSADIVMGTPVANRMQSELEPLIGFFINTLVLRVDTGQLSFEQFIEHVKKVNLAAQSNQDVPFEQLVERLDLPRSTQYSPLFQIMFSMDTNQQSNDSSRYNPNLRYSENVVCKFDLTLDVELSEAGGRLCWEFDRSIFKRHRIEQFNRHLQQLLTVMVKVSGPMPLHQLSMLSHEEIDYQLHQLNNTHQSISQKPLIQQWFEEQVENQPEAIAVQFEQRRLSYRQLNQQANQLARYLIAQGVVADTLVGLCIERSLDMVIAIMAIVKAGGAYVPMDPNYPQSRLDYILQDCATPLVLTQSHLQQRLAFANCSLVCVDQFDYQQYQYDNINADEIGLNDKHLAYVIYTSGSTGKPKGVMLAHQGLVNLVSQMRAAGFDQQCHMLQFASISFDAAVWEWASALCNGGRLVLCRDVTDVNGLSDTILQQQITHALLPAAYLALLPDHVIGAFRQLWTGGSVCAFDLAQKVSRLTQLINAYGPTEATVMTSYQQYQGGEVVAMGGPIQNHQLFVLDSHLSLLPVGVTGELYIGGAGLARGYLNKPELTEHAFIDNPFAPGHRLYKTGDLVRWLADGALEFIGRTDDQVKIRGFRIELGEVEHQLASCEGVESCAIQTRQDKHGEVKLVAYLVSQQGARESLSRAELISRLRRQLKQALPIHMIPDVFVLLNQWPLTINGKVDYKKLPEPSGDDLQTARYQPPTNEVQQQLCDIWQTLFAIEKVGIGDNFFELGGHSLLTVKLATEVSRRFTVKVSVFDCFQNQTIQSFAELLSQKLSADNNNSLIAMNPDGDNTPLFLIPGMGGSSHVFYPLFQQIDRSHPVYGIDAVGIDGMATPHDSIEAIALFNVECIVQSGIQPPYILVGHSLGGCVAFEMAKLLEQHGHWVTLFIIDVSPHLLGSADMEMPIEQEPEGMARGFAALAEQQFKIVYQPDDQSVHQVNLIQASQNKRVLAAQWQQYSRQPLQQFTVEGDHFSILKQPKVMSLAQIILGCLNN